MKKYLLNIITAVILIFLLFTFSGCAGTTNNTTGTTSSNGVLAVLVLGPEPAGKAISSSDRGNYVPLSGVRVSVVGHNLYSTTGSNGYATIDNVPAGTYTITVGKDGYQADIFTNVVVGGGATTQVGPATGVEIPISIAPYILDVSTLSASAGTIVTITGSNFGSTQGSSTVVFNGTTATPASWSSTSIVCAVPTGATTGNLVVTVGGTASNSVTFIVSAAPSGNPAIDSLSPSSGAVGTSVTITGSNFGSTQGSSTVTFNGTAVSSITSWSAASIVCAVPTGATTGNVVVTVGGTASNGVSFTITSPKLIIGGSFTTYNGASRNRTARINNDGSQDTSFDPGTGASGPVFSTAVTSGGKVVIGGNFTTYYGVSSNMIAQISADGAIDPSFDPGTGTGGINPNVYSVAVQSDDKILIGGAFTTYNGTARSKIARINSNGSLDTSFNPGGGGSHTILAVAIQNDGKILIGGDFVTYDGTGRVRLARVNSDGSLDTSFNPGGGADNQIKSIAVQSDGKIVIGGLFTTYNGTARSRIARINSDGTLDTTFDPGTGTAGALPDVYSVAVQSDGKIIIVGAFTTYNGTARKYIARINSDGALDTTFDHGTGAGAFVNSVAVLSNGKIAISGSFSSYNGTTRNKVAILNSDGSIDTSFDSSVGANDSAWTVAAYNF